MKRPERSVLLLAATAIAATVALTGCREEEQDRILLYEPGTYQGSPDRPLSPDQVEALRSRAQQQQY